MPGFDRTGPLGQGPMTGGGFGLCNPAYRGVFTGRPVFGVGRGGIPWGGGRGRAFGGGRGWFRGWNYPYPYQGFNPVPPAYPTYSARDERDYLENTLSALKEDIDRIQSRLDELATSDESK